MNIQVKLHFLTTFIDLIDQGPLRLMISANVLSKLLNMVRKKSFFIDGRLLRISWMARSRHGRVISKWRLSKVTVLVLLPLPHGHFSLRPIFIGSQKRMIPLSS